MIVVTIKPDGFAEKVANRLREISQSQIDALIREGFHRVSMSMDIETTPIGYEGHLSEYWTTVHDEIDNCKILAPGEIAEMLELLARRGDMRGKGWRGLRKPEEI